jgi:hypothetical protein
MAQNEQGQTRVGFLNGIYQNADIRHNPEKAVPIRTMSRKAALAGIIHPRIRSHTVPPGIRRPYFKTLPGQTPGKSFIPQGMFRHSVNNKQDRL